MKHQNIRNIAIVAHVDHGKTSIVDTLLRQTNSLSRQDEGKHLLLDSNDQEQERGITILSKVTAVDWKDHRINIIDTPGHSDFSGEVERVIDMADAALVVVDAVEGPMPQTRFVAEKAIKKGLKILVAINKIDRRESNVSRCLDKLYDLLIHLGATLEQLDFPVVCCSARLNFAYKYLSKPIETEGMAPLLDLIINNVEAPKILESSEPLMQIHQLDYSPYIGLIGIGRVLAGGFTKGQKVIITSQGKPERSATVKEVFRSHGLNRVAIPEGDIGDIIAISGIDNICISDIITTKNNKLKLGKLQIDKPMVCIQFSVNDSPFAGQEGKVLQSKALTERLRLEATHDVALKIKPSNDAGCIDVSGRGELHLGVLIEKMRREGSEFCISRPKVINNEMNKNHHEPYNKCFITCYNKNISDIIYELTNREATLISSETAGDDQSNLVFRGSLRGMLGLRHCLNNLSGGTASFHFEEDGFGNKSSENVGQRIGSVMVSNGTGKALNHALAHLQDRGRMMITHGEQVYKGQIIGAAITPSDLYVNCRQGKQLARVWRTTADKNYAMKATFAMSLEQAMTWINDDELIEVTPLNIRLAKRN